ncbi:MAG: hypothetical protein FJZ00_13945, partial [Candidatus Sericytochromatia bacterium]|nr:hypothetical protein [Candidatus Tanganyikabacteria bacterium]
GGAGVDTTFGVGESDVVTLDSVDVSKPENEAPAEFTESPELSLIDDKQDPTAITVPDAGEVTIPDVQLPDVTVPDLPDTGEASTGADAS